jgi:hypothetical protein
MSCMFYCYTGLTVIVILDCHMWRLLICFVKYYLDFFINELIYLFIIFFVVKYQYIIFARLKLMKKRTWIFTCFQFIFVVCTKLLGVTIYVLIYDFRQGCPSFCLFIFTNPPEKSPSWSDIPELVYPTYTYQTEANNRLSHSLTPPFSHLCNKSYIGRWSFYDVTVADPNYQEVSRFWRY